MARQLRRVLEERDMLASDGDGTDSFWTSGDPAESRRVISSLLGRHVTVEKLPAS